MRTEEMAPRVVKAEEKSGLKRISSMFVTAFSFAFFTLLAVLQVRSAKVNLPLGESPSQIRPCQYALDLRLCVNQALGSIQRGL
jgi:hypothetical protein